MGKISLSDSVNCAYASVTDAVLGIKSSVINLCADIDRYFKKIINVDLTNELDEFDFKSVCFKFPMLRNMTLDQINRLMKIFRNIRNVNAHLRLCKKIHIDIDVEDYFTNILKPEYKISYLGNLTVYGQAYILNFLSQKYNIFPFLITFYKKEYFIEICEMTGKEKSEFQTSQQHLLQEYCGNGKPYYNNEIDMTNYVFLNDTFKRHMSRIVYSIERVCCHTVKTFETSWTLGRILNDNEATKENEELIQLVNFLRNCWFHGSCLNDEVIFKKEKVQLTSTFILNMFIEIKKHLMKYKDYFKTTINELNKFGQACIDYYVLRLLEVSYKVLDCRLLTSEKIEKRSKNLDSAFKRIMSINPEFYELASKLIEPEELVFYLTAAKFSDNLPRITKCSSLKIIKLHSENGFQIGEYYTEQKILVFALIDLEEKYKNKVNGLYLDNYILNKTEELGTKISLFNGNGILANSAQEFELLYA